MQIEQILSYFASDNRGHRTFSVEPFCPWVERDESVFHLFGTSPAVVDFSRFAKEFGASVIASPNHTPSPDVDRAWHGGRP